jgi:hypothetical protein
MVEDVVAERGKDMEFELGHLGNITTLDEMYDSITNPFSMKTVRYREKIRKARLLQEQEEDGLPIAG